MHSRQGGQSSAQVAQHIRQGLARKIIDFQTAHCPTAEQMRTLTQLLTIDPGLRTKWRRRIDSAEVTGLLTLAGFRIAWARFIFDQYTLCARDSRGDTMLDAAYTYLYPNAGIENFWQSNRFYFVKEMATEGQSALVEGDLGTGKTNHALYLAETLIEMKLEQLRYIEMGKVENSNFYHIHLERERGMYREGLSSTDRHSIRRKVDEGPMSSRMGLYDSVDIQFPTNIAISPKSPYAKYFPRAGKMSEFVRLMCEGALVGKFSVPLTDELGFSFNKKRAMSIHNFGIEQILILIRKFNAAFLAIAQSLENQLPQSLTATARTKVHKLSKYTATYDVHGMGPLRRIRDVPGTTVKYRTRAFAPFETDMVPSLMVQEISRQEGEFLDNHPGEEWTDEMMYRAAIAFCTNTKNIASGEELGTGKSGVLRSEVRYMAQTIDPATGAPFTPERIAREFEDSNVTVEQVREIMAAVGIEEKKARQKKRAKAGYSSPVPQHDDAGDGGGDDGGDDGSGALGDDVSS